MRILTTEQQKNIQTLFRLSQEQLRNLMIKFLKKKEYTQITKTKDYIVGQGNIPITLVAHLDTVFDQVPSQIFYDEKQSVMWSPQGLGADDRAGVFAITEILRKGYRPNVIFTTEEESGCVGAQKLVKQNPKSLVDTKYIVQLDRRGSIDCVFYDFVDENFENYIESFGFKTANGTFTDISVIAPRWNVAAVNLSVGYFGEHSKEEILNTHFLLETIDKVEKMILSIDTAPYFEYKSYYSKDLFYDFYEEECDFCKHEFFAYEVIYALNKNGAGYIAVCPDCVVDKVNWCHACGEAYIKDDSIKTNYCPNCRYDNKKKDKGGNYYGFTRGTERVTGDKRAL